MNDVAWSHLHNRSTYKVYRKGFADYTVAKPDGSVLACRMTVWGCKVAIWRDKRKVRKRGATPPWWECPIVHEEVQ